MKLPGEDGMERCGWAGEDPLYIAYHDHEWGVPLRCGRALWETLVLEGFQAGLSWITILRKRENFRAAFQGFDPEAIAGWGAAEVARLMGDAGIVRHRGKIEAVIGNAQAWARIEAGGGFARYVWEFVEGRPICNHWETLAQVPAQTGVSVRMSKDLKRRGFRFCGPTTTYAFMQAAGLVNDHLVSCPCHARVARPG
jgi:DNA-3-methyladenine glycosylase I